jgi:hypothetical protein
MGPVCHHCRMLEMNLPEDLLINQPDNSGGAVRFANTVAPC